MAEVKILKPSQKSGGTGIKVPYFCFVVFEEAAFAQAAINEKVICNQDFLITCIVLVASILGLGSRLCFFPVPGLRIPILGKFSSTFHTFCK